MFPSSPISLNKTFLSSLHKANEKSVSLIDITNVETGNVFLLVKFLWSLNIGVGVFSSHVWIHAIRRSAGTPFSMSFPGNCWGLGGDFPNFTSWLPMYVLYGEWYVVGYYFFVWSSGGCIFDCFFFSFTYAFYFFVLFYLCYFSIFKFRIWFEDDMNE